MDFGLFPLLALFPRIRKDVFRDRGGNPHVSEDSSSTTMRD